MRWKMTSSRRCHESMPSITWGFPRRVWQEAFRRWIIKKRWGFGTAFNFAVRLKLRKRWEISLSLLSPPSCRCSTACWCTFGSWTRRRSGLRSSTINSFNSRTSSCTVGVQISMECSEGNFFSCKKEDPRSSTSAWPRYHHLEVSSTSLKKIGRDHHHQVVVEVGWVAKAVAEVAVVEAEVAGQVGSRHKTEDCRRQHECIF